MLSTLTTKFVVKVECKEQNGSYNEYKDSTVATFKLNSRDGFEKRVSFINFVSLFVKVKCAYNKRYLNKNDLSKTEWNTVLYKWCTFRQNQYWKIFLKILDFRVLINKLFERIKELIDKKFTNIIDKCMYRTYQQMNLGVYGVQLERLLVMVSENTKWLRLLIMTNL